MRAVRGSDEQLPQVPERFEHLDAGPGCRSPAGSRDPEQASPRVHRPSLGCTGRPCYSTRSLRVYCPFTGTGLHPARSRLPPHCGPFADVSLRQRTASERARGLPSRPCHARARSGTFGLVVRVASSPSPPRGGATALARSSARCSPLPSLKYSRDPDSVPIATTGSTSAGVVGSSRRRVRGVGPGRPEREALLQPPVVEGLARRDDRRRYPQGCSNRLTMAGACLHPIHARDTAPDDTPGTRTTRGPRTGREALETRARRPSMVALRASARA